MTCPEGGLRMICLRGSFVVGLHFYQVLGNHTNVDFFFKKNGHTHTHKYCGRLGGCTYFNLDCRKSAWQ